MSVKDLFKSRSNKIVTKQHVEQLKDEVESKKYIEAGVKSREKFVPKINFSEPKYFARYGSAEKYYEDSISYIFRTYPYDGSYAEKIKWHTDSTYLDNWMFENEYPRVTGYIDFNRRAEKGSPILLPDILDNMDGDGDTAEPWLDSTGAEVTWFEDVANPQYVHFKGGPNAHINKPHGSEAPDGKTDKLSELYPEKGGRANIWNDTEKYYETVRRSNLTVDAGLGNTVEFWCKTEENPVGQVCLFDMTDGKEPAITRVTIEHISKHLAEQKKAAMGGVGANPSLFTVTYAAKGQGMIQEPIGNFDGLGSPETQTVDDPFSTAGWNHYSFVFLNNSEGNLEARLFINGEHNDTVVWSGGSLDNKEVLGLQANLNSYITSPAG